MPPAKIFIVDDDPDDLELLREIFLEKGIEGVLFFDDPLLLLSYMDTLAADELPYLVLSDLNMPALSGIELLQELRLKNILNKTSVVIFSTSNAVRDRELCQLAGAKGFINKPFEIRDYYQLVDSLNNYMPIISL